MGAQVPDLGEGFLSKPATWPRLSEPACFGAPMAACWRRKLLRCLAAPAGGVEVTGYDGEAVPPKAVKTNGLLIFDLRTGPVVAVGRRFGRVLEAGG